MKKSRNGNFTVYEEDDNCALDEYSETLGEELEQAKENQDEKIETLQGENEELKAELKQIKDILPTVSAEGTNITLTPTIEDIFKEITIKGNTEQNSDNLSPDNPQDVKVVTGDNTVVISDGNNTNSQRLPLNLGNIELCKKEDYQDYMYKSNNKWYKHEIINKYIISSSDVTGINQYWYSQYGVYAVLIPKTVFGLETSRDTIKMLCNKFINNDLFVNNSLTCSAANSTSVVFLSDKFTDLATTKEILAGTIVYNPKEPEEIEITDTTLISQLEAISKATAYSEETNITTECEEGNVQAVIYAEAIMDMNNLVTRIEELESEV